MDRDCAITIFDHQMAQVSNQQQGDPQQPQEGGGKRGALAKENSGGGGGGGGNSQSDVEIGDNNPFKRKPAMLKRKALPEVSEPFSCQYFAIQQVLSLNHLSYDSFFSHFSF